MARHRSDRVDEIKALLTRRIVDGQYRTGERFLSNRGLATKHRVSYQTADRLIRELCQEGLLERRAASGTFIPGTPVRCLGAYLCFHSRSKLPNSLGAYLLSELTQRLTREGIRFEVAFDDDHDATIPDGWYPVFWEWESTKSAKFGLLLLRQPASGIDSTVWDSVKVDDFSGGVCAAQVLTAHVSNGQKWVVVSGPATDIRSQMRVAGFQSLLNANVIVAGWFAEDGERVAPLVCDQKANGIFCANDRLAEGLIRYASRVEQLLPPIVGFDDAPIAESLGITTIAIPWAEIIQAAVTTIRQRLADYKSTATHKVVSPRPVIRW